MHKSIQLLLAAMIFLGSRLHAQYQMEYLSRGVVAVNSGDGNVFVGWRLLGNEPYTSAFNLYRSTAGKTVKLNKSPLVDATGFTDEHPDSTLDHLYTVKFLQQGKEEKTGSSFLLKAHALPYISLPLLTPPGYAVNDASVGDMDGDGAYEFVLHMVGKGADNSRAGFTDPPIFQCYTLEGQMLWQINLGKNIREGAHYTQFMVYDLDGDGRAEIAMKTADGTIDGKGIPIGDSTKDYRDKRGYILSGPEYLTIFDGLTGAAIHTVAYDPPRHPDTEKPSFDQLKNLWGDGYGNRVDRFLAGIAYLDGVHPSLVMCRGYYTRTVLAAWDFSNKKLTKRWTFDSNKEGNNAFAGQGNHNLTIADVDNDGRHEIVYGQMTIDDNGKGLYSTGIGHADALHVSDLDPERPGLEVFSTQEKFGDAGANFRDARTGEVIWKKASIKAGEDGEGPGRALSIDVDPRFPGAESWVAGAGIRGMFDAKGNTISTQTPVCNMGIYWDGDALREVLNGVSIFKWKYEAGIVEKIFEGKDFGGQSINGSKSNPCLSADILGDWREEILVRSSDNKRLMIFSTAIPTDIKLHTLMHDPQYRMSIAWQNVAYNQPPHTSYFLGHGMKQPPLPKITINTKSTTK